MDNTHSCKIMGDSLPNIPWEEKPDGYRDIVWRYSKNPIIDRHTSPTADSIYNSAVVSFQDRFVGIFRCDDRCRNMTIRYGESDDGVHFRIADERLPLICEDPEIGHFVEGYDPRVVKVEDTYYINWCNNYHGYTIGMAKTQDFKTFHQMENVFLPFNRNAVLFPRKVNGDYLIFSRPSDSGHTPFGDIFISRSPDLIHWGRHRFVMGPKSSGEVNWEMTKIGAGPAPIETTEGWLLFYHGVLTTCNGFTYSMGAAILDLDEPWKVKFRCKPYLLAPWMNYEAVGNTPNVLFPCAALTDAATGRIAIYYGGADTCTGLCFCRIEEVVSFIKKNSDL